MAHCDPESRLLEWTSPECASTSNADLLMTPEKWETIARIFDEAAEMPASERSGLIDQACAGDAALRREVDRLLAENDSAGEFLEKPLLVPPDLGRRSRFEMFHPGHELAERFRVVRFLASGGMGEVYDAFD